MIRAKLALGGIANPLLELPDIHALLDITEVMLTEHMDARDRDGYMISMYRPTPGRLKAVAPQGFSDDEQQVSFDAAMKALENVERN